jgi:hypothetical protein
VAAVEIVGQTRAGVDTLPRGVRGGRRLGSNAMSALREEQPAGFADKGLRRDAVGPGEARAAVGIGHGDVTARSENRN